MAVDPKNYITTVKERLTPAQFRWTDHASFEGHSFAGVAHKSGFSLTKLGNSEEIFVFEHLRSSTRDELTKCSARAFRYALANKKCGLPRGFFNSVWVFSVALVDHLDSNNTTTVRNAAPPKHWAAAEVPVVVDLASGEVSYFQKTPLWGAAYYRAFRSKIQKFLLP